jgi:hypothetical protein
LGEQAVLAVIAVEVRKHGRCTITNGHIAALAGVGRSTVKRALREAAALGFIRVQERRISAFRNDSNVIWVSDPAWSAWLRLRRRGEGSKQGPARVQERKEGAAYRPRSAIGGGGGDRPEARFWRGA